MSYKQLTFINPCRILALLKILGLFLLSLSPQESIVANHLRSKQDHQLPDGMLLTTQSLLLSTGRVNSELNFFRSYRFEGKNKQLCTLFEAAPIDCGREAVHSHPVSYWKTYNGVNCDIENIHKDKIISLTPGNCN